MRALYVGWSASSCTGSCGLVALRISECCFDFTEPAGLTGKKVVVERVVPTRKNGCSWESKTAGLEGINGYISRKLHKA